MSGHEYDNEMMNLGERLGRIHALVDLLYSASIHEGADGLDHVTLPHRFCLDCGEVVSEAIRRKQCGQEQHVGRRRNRETCRGDCGEQLIAE